MPLIVRKYGGTSVGSLALIERVAEDVRAARERGDDLVVVLSAMGDSTDRLMDLARGVTSRPCGRELDALLATGEQAAVALLCMALEERGCKARSYTGAQVRVLTDCVHNKARIREVEVERLQNDLASGTVPVVAGFKGVAEDGAVTTIGRGGSDITAVALAAALGAEECQILSDVDGVYTTDPRMVPQARRLARLTFEEMIELASLGTRVLQIRAVAFAGKYGVPLRVLPSFGDGEGTLISFEAPDMEAPIVSGIAFNPDEAQVSVTGIPDEPGVAHAMLAPMAGAHIEVDMIVLNAPRDGKVDLSFTVQREDFPRAMELVRKAVEQFSGGRVCGNDAVAKLSVVGLGMRSHEQVATTLFAALASAGINVHMVATSEIKISVLVGEKDLEAGARALHRAFELEKEPTLAQSD